MSKEKNQLFDGSEFHGFRKNDGLSLIMCNGKKMMGTTVVYEIVSKVLSDKTVKRVRRHIGTSPDYIQGREGEVSFIATCPDTKIQYRIIGYVEEFVPKAICSELVKPNNQKITNILTETSEDKPVMDVAVVASEVGNPVITSVADSLEISSVALVTDIGQAKSLKSKQRQLEAFKLELEFIKVQIDAGFDPLISINALMHMSRRSRASIYRDFQSGKLGKRDKNGRSSFVLYSVAKAYMAGV
jgi:hypothetical protein